jgi:hypothetical protein
MDKLSKKASDHIELMMRMMMMMMMMMMIL